MVHFDSFILKPENPKYKVNMSLCLTNYQVTKMFLYSIKHNTMKTYGEVEVQIHILHLGTRWMDGQLHSPATLAPDKGNLVDIGKEAGWGQETIWTWQQRQNSLPSHASCSLLFLDLSTRWR